MWARFFGSPGVLAILLTLGGCATTVPVTGSDPAAPAAPFQMTANAGQPADRYPNASSAKQLDASLDSLKATKDDGNLTDDEYANARAKAVARFCDGMNTQQRQGQGITSQSLHDETGYLAQMKKENRLSNEEFEQARSAVIQYYQANGY